MSDFTYHDPEEQKPTLLEHFRDSVSQISERRTIGSAGKFEHEVFVPLELIRQQEETTTAFIKTAGYISRQKDWNCDVGKEEVVSMRDGVSYNGLIFVFSFNPDTDYGSILNKLDEEIDKVGS